MDVTQNRGRDDRPGYTPEDSACFGFLAEASKLLSNNFSSGDVMQASGCFSNSGEENSMCIENIIFPGQFATFDTTNNELVNLGSQHIEPHAWHPHDPLAPGIQGGTYPQKRSERKDNQKLQIQPVDRECNLQYEPMNPSSQHILLDTYSSGPLLLDWQQYASPPSDPQAPSTQHDTVPPKRRRQKDPKPKAWQWPPQTDQILEAIRVRAVKARKQRMAKSTEFDQLQRSLDDVRRENNGIRRELSECESRVRELEEIKNQFIR